MTPDCHWMLFAYPAGIVGDLSARHCITFGAAPWFPGIGCFASSSHPLGNDLADAITERRERLSPPPPHRSDDMTTATIHPPDSAESAFAREKAAIGALDAFLASGERKVPAGYRQDAKRRLVPEDLVPEHTRLEDDMVSVIIAHGLDLHRQIQRYRGHSYDDLAALDDLLGEKYGQARRGGVKGNRTYTSLDGCRRVIIQVQDRIAFGPELQVARDLVNECIADWSADARSEVQALIQHAFEPDREGMVNREAVFALRRLDIKDERWQRAREAITDSIRVVGSASYIRLQVRAAPEADWTTIPIDLAKRALPEKLGS